MNEIERTAFEQHCDELDNKVEALTPWEKRFVLWRLIREYGEELKVNTNPESVTEMYAAVKTADHKKTCKEIADVLCGELF